MSHQTITISAAQDGQRIDRICQRSLNVPFSLVQKLLRKGAIKLDDKRIKQGDMRVRAGQTLFLPTIEASEATIIPDDKAKKWLQEHLLWQGQSIWGEIAVINKPTGLASQGGSKINHSLDAILKQCGDGQGYFPRLVHRLDKETSGAMLVAYTADAARLLTGHFASRNMEKTYLAITHQCPRPHQGMIDLPLAKLRMGGEEKMAVDKKQGKKAQTTYQVVDHAMIYALLTCQPLTGRTHQIRAHLAAIGCPIMGDDKYGDASSTNLQLHAWKITIPADCLPNKKSITITAPIPKNMQSRLKELGLKP